METRKVYQRISKDLIFIGLVSLSVGMTGLSTGCSKSSSSISGSLQVASLQTFGAASSRSGARMALRPGANGLVSASTDLPASSGHYSFAKIDGIKVTVTEVRGADAKSDNPLVTHTVNKEIELTDDPTAPVALNETVSWVAGDYSGIDLRLANAWKVKAYCKTQASGSNFTLVYTTAAGVATQACTTSSCTLPASYDYYSYNFLDDYYTVHGGDPNIATHYKFTIAAGATPVVRLLFDATNTVACWDGASWSDSFTIGAFRGPSSDRRSVLWPDGTPAFAVPVMPVLTYVTTDAIEAAPTARTFFAADSASALADPISFDDTQTLTILYKSDGTAVTASARNLSGNGADNPLEMDYSSFATSTTGTGIDFYASGWYYQGGSTAPELIPNRKIEGFALPATEFSVFSTTIRDGSGCGQTLTDFQGNNPSKACLGTGVTQTLYFREAVR